MNIKKKLKTVNADEFGLPSRIKLAIDSKDNHYIIKNIKSRIIMKDGEKINIVFDYIVL